MGNVQYICKLSVPCCNSMFFASPVSRLPINIQHEAEAVPAQVKCPSPPDNHALSETGAWYVLVAAARDSRLAVPSTFARQLLRGPSLQGVGILVPVVISLRESSAHTRSTRIQMRMAPQTALAEPGASASFAKKLHGSLTRDIENTLSDRRRRVREGLDINLPERQPRLALFRSLCLIPRVLWNRNPSVPIRTFARGGAVVT